LRRPQARNDPILRYAGLFNKLGDRRALLKEPQQLQRKWLGAGMRRVPRHRLAIVDQELLTCNGGGGEQRTPIAEREKFGAER
jgi:hypothetical protein